MGQSALLLNTDKLLYPVRQVGHGFLPGHVIRFDKATLTWVKAQANTEANCSGCAQVSFKVDDDFFYYTQVGTTYGLTSQVFVPGDTYWLSPTTAGELVNVKPTAIGQVEVECFKATGTDKGVFWGGSGELIQSGSLFSWTTILGSQTLASNMGYILNGSAPSILTLPPAPASGDVIKIRNFNTTFPFTIDYAAGQSITLAEVTSTITTGDVTIDTTNGVYAGSCTLTYQIVGNWLMEAFCNWIVT